MEIGAKIKNARGEANLTQEQAADALGVSRQTISNWENEKTYPDIVSVIKMSDIYNISLDRLLKEENTMSNYIDYLEESTNTVKSKRDFSKLILIVSYLVIWAVSIAVFWFYADGSDAMAYGLIFIWIVHPVAIFVISLLIGKNNYWGKFKWLAAVVFGMLYMFIPYTTFDIANMISFNKVLPPLDFSVILIGMAISFFGLAIGSFINRIKAKKKNK